MLMACRSYKLISHPLNSNPFAGSFVNYAASFRLLSVTLSNKTFCEMEVSKQQPCRMPTVMLTPHMLYCARLALFCSLAHPPVQCLCCFRLSDLRHPL